MTWIVLAVALVALVLVNLPSRRRRRRERWLAEAASPPVTRRPTGTGYLGEAPPTVHHRLGTRTAPSRRR